MHRGRNISKRVSYILEELRFLCQLLNYKIRLLSAFDLFPLPSHATSAHSFLFGQGAGTLNTFWRNAGSRSFARETTRPAMLPDELPLFPPPPPVELEPRLPTSSFPSGSGVPSEMSDIEMIVGTEAEFYRKDNSRDRTASSTAGGVAAQHMTQKSRALGGFCILSDSGINSLV